MNVSKKPALDILTGSFGFDPAESASHFLVIIPTGTTQTIVISEHLSWDPEHIEDSVHYGERLDGQVAVVWTVRNGMPSLMLCEPNLTPV